MTKNLIFDPILVRLAQIWATKNFFVAFISTRRLTLSRAIIICNFKENLWSKLKEISKNLILGLISNSPKTFSWVLLLVVFRNCSKLSPIQFKGKVMNQTRENDKKTNFGPDFASFGPNLGPQNFLCRFCFH